MPRQRLQRRSLADNASGRLHLWRHINDEVLCRKLDEEPVIARRDREDAVTAANVPNLYRLPSCYSRACENVVGDDLGQLLGRVHGAMFVHVRSSRRSIAPRGGTRDVVKADNPTERART